MIRAISDWNCLRPGENVLEHHFCDTKRALWGVNLHKIHLTTQTAKVQLGPMLIGRITQITTCLPSTTFGFDPSVGTIQNKVLFKDPPQSVMSDAALNAMK
jgi:hypothetical protein